MKVQLIVDGEVVYECNTLKELFSESVVYSFYKPNRTLTTDVINKIDLAFLALGLDPKIKIKNRRRPYVFARMLVFHILYIDLGVRQIDIADFFQCERSTVAYLSKKCNIEMSIYDDFKSKYKIVQKILTNGQDA